MQTEKGGEIFMVFVSGIVRLLFRLRTGSAGLLEDKRRCKMIIDVCEWCSGRCGAFIGVVWGI